MKLKDIPLNKAQEILKSGKSAAEQRQEPISLLVLLDPAASDTLVLAVRDALVPMQATAHVAVEQLEEHAALPISKKLDACIVVAGGSDALCADALRSSCAASVPCCAVALTSVDAPTLKGESLPAGLVVSQDTNDLLERLARWIVDNTEKDLAFAANFPFIRPAKVQQLIQKCAAENAAVGAVALIPGADMPVMTANQAKLALDIAAVYGQDLSPERLVDVAGVVGGGFAWRAVARQVLGLVPGFGALAKAGIGYAGTVATGQALKARFEAADALGEILPEARQKLNERFSESLLAGIKDRINPEAISEVAQRISDSPVGDVARDVAGRIFSKQKPQD